MLSNMFSPSRHLEVFQLGLAVAVLRALDKLKGKLNLGRVVPVPQLHAWRYREEAERSVKAPSNHPRHISSGTCLLHNRNATQVLIQKVSTSYGASLT